MRLRQEGSFGHADRGREERRGPAPPGRLWEKRVVLRERESEPTHAQELREAILQAATVAGTKLDPSAPLARLVEWARERYLYPRPRRRRWSFANRFAKPS